jgi:hypothetical protein
MAPPPPTPVPLFPPPPAIALVANGKLQDSLQKAVTAVTIAGNPPPFGLTIVDLTSASASASGSGKDFASAGWNQDVEHYAASMLKVACLYAAHALRDLVQRFALARKPKDLNDLFRMLKAELDPQIAVCCPRVTGRAPKVRLPQWQDVFTASGAGAGLSVRFTPSYTTSLEKMIVPSDNGHAGRCIRGVGYAYLNGLMLKHGFFDESDSKKPKGVWLAGDFSGSDVVTIPCDNDTDTKQGTSSAMMARLGTVILMGTVLPAASHGEMTELLKKSAHGSDSSYFTRPEMTTDRLSGDQVTHGKIGLGPLKSHRDVFSDLNRIANPAGGGGSFITCFTNADYHPYSINDVLRTFLQTVRIYQSVAAAAPAAPTPTVAPRATVTH